MDNFDVFNGDADGICALHQMRLAKPVEAELITGIKRDIELVERVDAKPGDHILVLDVSLAKNVVAVNKLIEKGCHIQYFDHHLAADVAVNNCFENFINTSPDTCTSLLVNKYLNGKQVLWAIVGAYGDNMLVSADSLAGSAKLTKEQKASLQELGIYLNYNGYGTSLDDLHFNPEDLYRAIKPYENPFDFIEKETVFKTLKTGYLDDMNQANLLTPTDTTDNTAIFILPAEKWCRRVSGVFGNDLSNQFPERAHALLTDIGNDAYQVSVRAPQDNKTGAGTDRKSVV